MLIGVVTLLLATAPTVAVPGLSGVGLDSARVDFLTEHVAQTLRASGLSVVTRREIAVMLGLERQRQLLGCSDGQTACNVELANALGSDTVLLGDVAKLESGWYQVNLKILSANTGRPLSARSGRIATDSELVDALSRAANEMARETLTALRPDEPLPPQAFRDFGRHPLRIVSWVPALVAVAGGVTCGVFLAQANSVHVQLTQDPKTALTQDQTLSAVQRGQTAQTVGFVALGAAAVGLAVTAFLFFLRTEPDGLKAMLPFIDLGSAVAGASR